MAILAVVVLLAIVPSCTHDKTGATAFGQSYESEDDFWADSCFRLNTKANNYFNAGQTDSLEAFVPQAMKICLEHNEMIRYYSIWRTLAERYVCEDNFEKAMAEVQLMQDDAIRRNIRQGLFEAYFVMGVGYGYRNNSEEAAKYLRKAIAHFDSPYASTLLEAYFYLVQVLMGDQQYEALDTVLKEWKTQIDKKQNSNLPVDILAHWNYQYRRLLAEYLMDTGKYHAASEALDSAEYYLGLEDDMALDRLYLLRSRGILANNQKQFNAALDYSQQMQQLAAEIDDNNGIVSAMMTKVNALEGLNRYQEALELQHKLITFRDSLNNASNAEQLNQLNKRFEVNELKMQADHEHMKAVQQRFYLLSAIILLMVFGAGLFVFYRIRSDRRLAKMKASQERIEGELKIAHDIQMSMVPSEFPVYPGLDMYASMTPAKEVGGDLFNYVLKRDMLYFCVGDVSGKGVPASLFMAQVTRLFHSMANGSMSPVDICNVMNIELSGNDNINGMFVTLFVCRLNLKLNSLEYCNAGHNPPVLGNADGQFSFLDMETNAPIGLWPDLRYVGEEIEYFKDRLMLLYTDGLNEAENLQQEQFGDERLLEVLRHSHWSSARNMVETLGAKVEEHRNGAESNDDLTMLCLKLNTIS